MFDFDTQRYRFSSLLPVLAAIAAIVSQGVTRAAPPDHQPLAGDNQAVAGPFGNLDGSLRRFGILQAVDLPRRAVTLLLEGETEAQERLIRPDAEIWYAGWWGRLEQLTAGDRVWVWREKESGDAPAAVTVIADELSQQELYAPVTVKAVAAPDAETVTVEAAIGKESIVRTLKITDAELYRGESKAPLQSLAVGETLYVQTTGDRARLMLDATAFTKRRADQQAAIRQRWADEGLPGTLIISHVDSDEAEVMLAHESLRWGRSLQAGDEVTLLGARPVAAVVRKLRPWRERTQVLLSIDGANQSALSVGERVMLRMPAPPAGLENDRVPPVPRDPSLSTSDRVEWLVSCVYCPCGMHDNCAGHILTLAACNGGPKGSCGTAVRIRKEVADMIDRGLCDAEIVAELRKTHGPNVLRPHMLP
jgi:hypothetical protein